MSKGNPKYGSLTLPTKFIPLGGVLDRCGEKFVAVPRPHISSLAVADACKGCYFAKCPSSLSNCNTLQCSVWDRADKRDVWFVPMVEVE